MYLYTKGIRIILSIFQEKICGMGEQYSVYYLQALLSLYQLWDNCSLHSIILSLLQSTQKQRKLIIVSNFSISSFQWKYLSQIACTKSRESAVKWRTFKTEILESSYKEFQPWHQILYLIFFKCWNFLRSHQLSNCYHFILYPQIFLFCLLNIIVYVTEHLWPDSWLIWTNTD